MRFTFAAIVVTIVALTSATVIPRANSEPSGLESRYFRREVYARAEPAPKVVARSEPGRLHARDFRMRTN